MPNYSLRLRPRYGPDEPTGGERIVAGIGGALQDYLSYQDQQRQERNEVAARGGQPIAQQGEPGVMGRLRGIGDAIRRRMAGDPVETGMQTGTDVARDGYGPSQVTPPRPDAFTPNTRSLNPPLQPTPPFAPQTNDLNPRGGAPASRGPFTPQLTFNAQPPAGPSRDGQQVPQGGVPADSSTPAAPVSASALPKRRGIADALQPIIYEGRGGSKYSIDPLYQTRVGIAGHEMEADAAEQRTIATEQRHAATLSANQQQQIDALTQAGMPAGEARARVLTGTVRYDETFGQYRPNNGNLTFEQRQTLQTQKDNAAYTRAKLASEGKQNTEEFRRATLALQAADLALKAADTRAAGFEKNAAAAEGQVPKDPITRQIAESQPGGKAAIQHAESTAAANRDSATRIRGEGSAAAGGVAAGVGSQMRDDTGTRGTVKTPEMARSRALQLKGQGKTKQQVYEIMRREGFNVAPPKGDIDLRTPR